MGLEVFSNQSVWTTWVSGTRFPGPLYSSALPMVLALEPMGEPPLVKHSNEDRSDSFQESQRGPIIIGPRRRWFSSPRSTLVSGLPAPARYSHRVVQ